MLVAEHGRTVSKPAGCWVAVVALRYFVAVLRRGTAATASLDADSGVPCGQQVLWAHNDVGAGAGGKPAGADCE